MSTIKDVAKHAGVSIATVSHIINGTKSVTPQTRERVLKAIKELNYITNQTAKSFKTGKKKIIAFVVPDISNNYFSNIIEALEEELTNSGYHLILTNTKESKEREIQQLRYLTSGIADGIVLASTMQNYSEISSHVPENFPMVLVDRKLENCPWDIISISDISAITTGTNRLIQNGHTRIGYIGDSSHLSTAKERFETYRNVLIQNNISINEELIKETTSLSHDTFALTEYLLKKQCTAIIVGNNIMTLEAYSYLHQHKDQFPSIQILGYYHRNLIHLFSPQDGIIMLNEKDVGTAAGKQIIKRINEPDMPQKEIVICNQYIEKANMVFSI